MIEIQLTNREIGMPGLYLMKWQGRIGLVRIVGSEARGYTIIAPESTPETYMRDLPKDGVIPLDALFSEALAVVAPK